MTWHQNQNSYCWIPVINVKSYKNFQLFYNFHEYNMNIVKCTLHLKKYITIFSKLKYCNVQNGHLQRVDSARQCWQCHLVSSLFKNTVCRAKAPIPLSRQTILNKMSEFPTILPAWLHQGWLITRDAALSLCGLMKLSPQHVINALSTGLHHPNVCQQLVNAHNSAVQCSSVSVSVKVFHT